MKTANQKIEISLSPKEQEVIETMSRQCKMSSSQLVRTILFNSGILCTAGEAKR